MDLSDFQIGGHSFPPGEKLIPNSQKKINGKFLKGPIPLEWLKQAAPLSGKAMQIALCIWFLIGVKRDNTVKLSYKLLKEFGVSRSSSYRGLEALENAGLIAIERHPGRSPIVTLREYEKP